MASPDPNAARNAPVPQTSHHGEAAGQNVDLKQLDRVLETTLAQLHSTQEAAPPELLEVARRHRGVDFSLPVAQELVRAVLWPEWQEVSGGAEGFAELCAHIADTLFEDPVAHARLRNMWSALAGMVA